MNAKYGFRKPGTCDYAKLVQQYNMLGSNNLEDTKNHGTS